MQGRRIPSGSPPPALNFALSFLSREKRKGRALTDSTKLIRAEFRARQAEDGRKAMAEYLAQKEVVRARTERLRALRLARDKALDGAAASAKAAGKASAPAKRATKTARPAGVGATRRAAVASRSAKPAKDVPAAQAKA